MRKSAEPTEAREGGAAAGGDAPVRRRRRSRWRTVAPAIVAVVAVLVAARLALPTFVRDYVNRTLDLDPMHDGTIGDVTIHLWRGAYTIEDVSIVKTTGLVPVPLFAAERVDLAIEWPALWSGAVVGRMVLDRPEINFVDAESASGTQTGAGGAWLQIIDDLFPFDINSAVVRDGRVHFRAFDTDPPVDVYLSRVEGVLENLTNIHDDVTPLFATVKARAVAMDEAPFDLTMRLDPLSYRPSFALAARIVDLDVTKTNALAHAYGRVDFHDGRFDLVVELDAKEGSLQGYVKPIFRGLEVFDFSEDVRGGDFLGAFWEALVGGAQDLLKNQPRDQLATVIPLEGDLRDPESDLFAIVGNVLRNAFVRAYLPRFEGASPSDAGVVFGPAAAAGPGGP
jgi:hypothetical protein